MHILPGGFVDAGSYGRGHERVLKRGMTLP
jgi:hypothetical protein